MLCIIKEILMKPFTSIDQLDLVELIGRGRPTPPLTNLETEFNGKVLQFDPALYNKHDWLCGSEFYQAVFCWPCLLFAQDRISYWTKLGYKELTGLPRAASCHEDSIGHIRSLYQYNQFVSEHISPPREPRPKAILNRTILRNYKFLKAVINGVFFLAKGDTLLDKDNPHYINIDNFTLGVEVFCDDDEMVKETIRPDAGSSTTATQFMIDCIEAIAKGIQETIKTEVKDAPFVTLIIDEPSDTPTQIYVGLRYLINDKLVERMLGFLDTSDCDLTQGVQEYLMEFEVGDRLIAQAWGGTSSSMQTQVDAQNYLKTQTTAQISLTYDVSDLILMLIDSIYGIPGVGAFFAGLQKIISFPFNETDRVAAGYRSELVHRSLEGSNFLSNMLAVTKNPVQVISQNREALIARFKQIVEKGGGIVESQILGACAHIYAFLKEESVIKYLSVFEKHFDIIQEMVNGVNEAWTDGFTTARCRDLIFKGISEMRDNIQTQLSEEKLPASIHENVLSALNVIGQSIPPRLNDLDRLRFFRLFRSENYRQFLKSFPDDLIDQLMSLYARFFNRSRLKNELLVVYGLPEFAGKTPAALFNKFNEDKRLVTIFPEVYKLLQLMITLPTNFSSVSNGSLPQRVRRHTSKCVGLQRVTELAVIEVNLDLFGQVKEQPDFFNTFIDDLANKQREMELKQFDDEGDSEMGVHVSIRHVWRSNLDD